MSFFAVLCPSCSSCKNTSSILHLSVYLHAQLFSPHFFLTPLGLSHPLSTMKCFAFCTIGPSTQGQHPRGHINSTVRTMPPSCQLPSASIPSRERERRRERDSGRARGWNSLEKKRKGGERREKQKNKCTWPLVFFPRGVKRKEVTVDLGLSLLSCLGHNSECVDVCGCLCAISKPRAPLQGDSLRHFQAQSVKHLSSCL